MARINWSSEELILAADALARNRFRALTPVSPIAIELMEYLQSDRFHPVHGRDATFRSIHSICRKSSDILSSMPSYSGTPTNASNKDKILAIKLEQNPEDIRTKAAAIRAKLG